MSLTFKRIGATFIEYCLGRQTSFVRSDILKDGRMLQIGLPTATGLIKPIHAVQAAVP
jgi:hypothetical protein